MFFVLEPNMNVMCLFDKYYIRNEVLIYYNRNYSAILTTLQITSYALGV
jgi:hypothetical protein